MTQREKDILKIIVRSNRGMIVQEIANSGSLSESTVISVIKKLLMNGLVEVTGRRYSGKVLSREYMATQKGRRALLIDIKKQIDELPVDFKADLIQMLEESK